MAFPYFAKPVLLFRRQMQFPTDITFIPDGLKVDYANCKGKTLHFIFNDV